MTHPYPYQSFYRAILWNEPVRVRPEFGETEPAHADMLRYDLAFCNPEDPSVVCFPIFKHSRDGRTSDRITLERWRSFSMKLEAVETLPAKSAAVSVGSYVTYQHPEGTSIGLEKKTLDQFLAANLRLRIVGWRTL
jgi:hypothetical protein